MELLSPDFGFIFWHSMIMLATFLILGRFAWKPLLRFIKTREEAHQKAILERKEAQKEIETVEATKANILQKAEKEKETIMQQALQEKEDLLENAEKEALEKKKKIVAEGLKVIAHEKEMAQSALKKQTVAIILNTTEKLIAKELTQTKEQQQLIEKMMAEVETTPNSD